MYLILNPNGKPVAQTLKSWGLSFVEVRETATSADAGVVAVEHMDDWRALERLAAATHFESPLRGVISCHESTMLAAAYLRESYGLDGAPIDYTIAFVNKHVMKKRAASGGIRVAEHELLSRAALNQLTEDRVIKPAVGASCIGTRRCGVLDAAALAVIPPASIHILERAVDVVAEYHVDTIIEQGAVRWSSVWKYFEPPLAVREVGGSSFMIDSGVLDYPALEDANTRVLAALNARDGVFHAEFLKDATGHLIFGEIACRPGGGGIGGALRHAARIDLMAEHLRLSLDCVDRARIHYAPPPPQHRRMGWLVLPCAPGRIRRLTPRQRLESQESVVGVEQHFAVGDVVTGERHPYLGAYTVYLDATDEGRFGAACASLRAMYCCETV